MRDVPDEVRHVGRGARHAGRVRGAKVLGVHAQDVLLCSVHGCPEDWHHGLHRHALHRLQRHPAAATEGSAIVPDMALIPTAERRCDGASRDPAKPFEPQAAADRGARQLIAGTQKSFVEM